MSNNEEILSKIAELEQLAMRMNKEDTPLQDIEQIYMSIDILEQQLDLNSDLEF